MDMHFDCYIQLTSIIRQMGRHIDLFWLRPTKFNINQIVFSIK